MTSPNASPQKPSERTPQKQAQAAGNGSARGTPVKAATTAATAASAIVAPLTPQKVASPARSVAKWQWHETTIHDSGVLGWMRVWRLSKLLLQANC